MYRNRYLRASDDWSERKLRWVLVNALMRTNSKRLFLSQWLTLKTLGPNSHVLRDNTQENNFLLLWLCGRSRCVYEEKRFPSLNVISGLICLLEEKRLASVKPKSTEWIPNSVCLVRPSWGFYFYFISPPEGRQTRIEYHEARKSWSDATDRKSLVSYPCCGPSDDR